MLSNQFQTNQSSRSSVYSIAGLRKIYSNTTSPQESQYLDTLTEELKVSPPKIIHFSNSIPTNEAISPLLWNWIMSRDFAVPGTSDNHGSTMDDVKGVQLLSYNGNRLEFPKHLVKKEGVPSALQRGKPLPKRPTVLASLNPPPLPARPSIPRFFLQRSRQTYQTSVHQCNQESLRGYGLNVLLNEAFLFDVPTENEEFTVVIEIFSTSTPNSLQRSSLAESQSIESLADQSSDNYSLSNPKRISRRKSFKLNPFQQQQPKSDQGDVMVGELSFSLPTKNVFPKLSATHSFCLNGKKEIAKGLMQMGLFMDEKFSVVPEQYFCILQNDFLKVYDSEYKLSLPVGQIPISQIKSITIPSIETIYADLTFSLNINHKNFIHISTLSSGGGKARLDMGELEWENVWRESLVEKGELLENNGIVPVYVSADLVSDFGKWKGSFDECLRNFHE